uniref:Uncharacterized protein n=1 Tax=Cacopsylla melanoneura TaxID=428564 RepID=A0A8D8R6U1_9HEMI
MSVNWSVALIPTQSKLFLDKKRFVPRTVFFLTFPVFLLSSLSGTLGFKSFENNTLNYHLENNAKRQNEVRHHSPVTTLWVFSLLLPTSIGKRQILKLIPDA